MSNSGTINAVNSATTIPLTAGSYLSFQAGGPGTGVLSFQVTVTGSVTLHVGVCIDTVNLVQLPDASITNANTGSTGAVTASGVYTIPVTAGTIYVYNGSGSGSAIVTGAAGIGSGTPGASGGGDAVVANAGSGWSASGLSTSAAQILQGLMIGPSEKGFLNTGPSNQTSYIGLAPLGTAEASTGWYVGKVLFDTNNLPSRITWATNSGGSATGVTSTWSSLTFTNPS